MVWAKSRPPEALMAAMRRKGVEPKVTGDAFKAMAEVVTGGSLDRAKAILVLVEPSELRGKRAMLTSCRKYAPTLRVWVYQSQAQVQLRPLELSKLVPEPEEAPAEHTFGGDPSASTVMRSPSLRLAQGGGSSHRNGESRGPDWRNQDSLPGVSAAARAADNPSGYRPSGLLTDEELAMLLADDPEDRKKR
ncbi:MAG: hypothetical protein AAFY46_12460 [Planctomycetota bacterium]